MKNYVLCMISFFTCLSRAFAFENLEYEFLLSENSVIKNAVTDFFYALEQKNLKTANEKLRLFAYEGFSIDTSSQKDWEDSLGTLFLISGPRHQFFEGDRDSSIISEAKYFLEKRGTSLYFYLAFLNEKYKEREKLYVCMKIDFGQGIVFVENKERAHWFFTSCDPVPRKTYHVQFTEPIYERVATFFDLIEKKVFYFASKYLSEKTQRERYEIHFVSLMTEKGKKKVIYFFQNKIPIFFMEKDSINLWSFYSVEKEGLLFQEGEFLARVNIYQKWIEHRDKEYPFFIFSSTPWKTNPQFGKDSLIIKY